MRTCKRHPEQGARQLACCGLLAALLTVLLAGCQTTPPQEVEAPPEPTTPAASATIPAAEQTPEAPPDTAAAPAAPQATPVEPAQPAAAGTTTEEHVQTLERELETSYEEHDAMLRDHQASVRAEAAEIAAQRAGRDGGGDPDEEAFEQGGLYQGLPGFGAPPPDTEAGTGTGGGEITTAAGDDRAGTASTAANGGAAGGQVGGATVPADIPDGRDDDIVARQLREAAQMEKDPELREKLWDEYRKYKNRQAAQ